MIAARCLAPTLGGRRPSPVAVARPLARAEKLLLCVEGSQSANE